MKMELLKHFKLFGEKVLKLVQTSEMKLVCKKGFTLIELLVVIAIIGILASMLLPALHKARERGREAVCLSNLKQHALGSHIYAESNNSWLPVSGVSDPGHWQTIIPLRWRQDVLDSYSEIDIMHPDPKTYEGQSLMEGIFNCPSSATIVRSGGYGWNWAYLGRRKEDSNSLGKGRNNLDAVPIPAETLMTGDGTEAEGDWWRRAYLFTDSWYSGLGNRHNSGKNIQVSWVDGHSSSMSKTTLSVDSILNYYFLIEKP